MMCDNCIKADVCPHQKEYRSLERHYEGLVMNDIFHVQVVCEKYLVAIATKKQLY
jgi:hypothetical protein